MQHRVGHERLQMLSTTTLCSAQFPTKCPGRGDVLRDRGKSGGALLGLWGLQAGQGCEGRAATGGLGCGGGQRRGAEPRAQLRAVWPAPAQAKTPNWASGGRSSAHVQEAPEFHFVTFKWSGRRPARPGGARPLPKAASAAPPSQVKWKGGFEEGECGPPCLLGLRDLGSTLRCHANCPLPGRGSQFLRLSPPSRGSYSGWVGGEDRSRGPCDSFQPRISPDFLTAFPDFPLPAPAVHPSGGSFPPLHLSLWNLLAAGALSD